jgi:hypothetical protein
LRTFGLGDEERVIWYPGLILGYFMERLLSREPMKYVATLYTITHALGEGRELELLVRDQRLMKIMLAGAGKDNTFWSGGVKIFLWMLRMEKWVGGRRVERRMIAF